MRLRLALLALLGLLLAWVWFLARERPAPQDAQSLAPPGDFGRPVRFRFESPAETVLVRRVDGDYEVVEPLRDRADPTVMGEVERQSRRLEARRFLPGEDPGRFGLAPVRRRLVLEDSLGRRWALVLGDTSAVASEVYARRDDPGAPVALIDFFTARRHLLPELDRIRSRVAAPLRGGPVDSIAVLAPGFDLRAARLSRETWSTRVPEGLDIEPLRVNRAIELLRNPAIRRFAEPGRTAASLGLDPPAAVWILFQGARRETVRVGAAADDGSGIWVAPSGGRPPALLEGAFAEDLARGWPALADRHLVGRVPESFGVVEISQDGRSLRYERGSTGWTREGEPAERAAALERELANLAQLQWLDYPLRETPPPVASPRLKIVLQGGSTADTVEIAPLSGSRVVARSSRRPRWGEVPSGQWTPWAYRAGIL